MKDRGESSNDVEGSGASTKKWKNETDNGQVYSWGGRGLTSVQYSLYLHMLPS